jgi:hypothetical protein
LRVVVARFTLNSSNWEYRNSAHGAEVIFCGRSILVEITLTAGKTAVGHFEKNQKIKGLLNKRPRC